MDDDFVADLPALDLGANRPDHAGSVGTSDVKRMLVTVERRDRNAQARPDAVVIDAAGHDVDQDFVFGDRPGWDHLALHRLFRRAVPFLAYRPGIHFFRNVAERWDFADLIEIFGGGG